MRWKTFAIGYSLALALLVFAQRHPAADPKPHFAAVIDLSHSISAKVPAFDASETFSVKNVASYDKEGYFAREVSFPEHFSTHVDAPVHFARGRWTVDQIPPERLFGPLVVMDVTRKTDTNPDYEVSVSDVADWEQVNGEIPPGAIVMAHTGWSSRWENTTSYRNADSSGTAHFPGFSLSAARFLVESRDAVGIGIDTLSIDPGKSKDFPVHKYLAGHSVYVVESVANLDRAPEVAGIAMVAPARIQGGSGAPARVFALVR